MTVGNGGRCAYAISAAWKSSWWEAAKFCSAAHPVRAIPRVLCNQCRKAQALLVAIRSGPGANRISVVSAFEGTEIVIPAVGAPRSMKRAHLQCEPPLGGAAIRAGGTGRRAWIASLRSQ